MSSTKKLRIAFIGAGGIAGAHLKALAKMEDVEVVALADSKNDPMMRYAEEYNIPAKHCYDDPQTMLEKVEPDAVSVCTPNGEHCPNTIAALKAGSHVIVEKPMAMSAEEARQMVDTAKAVDRKLVIGFQYRYDPRTQFLKQAVDDGVLGKVMFGRVQAMRRRGIPNWGVFGQKKLQGGGPMIDIGVHVLEMCHYTMGSPKPVAAVGMTDTYLGNKPSAVKSSWPNWDHKTYTVEDFACGHIRFDNGAVIHVESMFAGHIEREVMDFQLMGHKGGGLWSDSKIFTDQLGHMVDIKPNYLPPHNFGMFFDWKLRNFVDHVLYNKPTGAPAEHGLLVQQMLDGVYRSAEQGGKEVALDELVAVE
ncbi:MAG: Gfo/Idh/MocA family oxidoreductase [Phycisphaeraceae bacterium]